MRTIVAALFLSSAVWGQSLATGFRLEKLNYQGPGEWEHRAETVWVYEYHTLRLRYRASGLESGDAPVIALRPGVVRPPVVDIMAQMQPVVVARARDLAADGREHTLDIELNGKVVTAQVDEVAFSLPAGARLEVHELEFRADEGAIPCATGGPALPPGAPQATVRGPLDCAGYAATSLRGKEAIRIDAKGRTARTMYLSAAANMPGLSRYRPGAPPASFRTKESRETSEVLARVRYADGSEEEQFPLLVKERRHAVLNRTPALYALALEPRPVAAVELLDRSPHLQLVVFGAAFSPGEPPQEGDENRLPPPPARKATGEVNVESSQWYRIEPARAGAPLAGANLRPELQVKREGMNRRLNLAVTNAGSAPAEFKLVFPAVEARPAAGAGDVYYAFPRVGAIIGRAEKKFEEAYGTRFPLQFLDAFSPAANQGACVVVRDTGGHFKTFRLEKHGASVKMEAEYPVRLAPGETFRAPEADLTMHGGDWREGFAAYRRWVATWHKRAAPRPKWLQSAFWARRDYPLGGSGQLFDTGSNRYTFDRLMRDAERLGGIDLIDISGWGASECTGRVGDYPIELGGSANLRENIALAAKAGVRTGLYFEGYLIDKRSAIAQRSGAAWQMVNAAGQPMWYRPTSPEMHICPLIPEWQRYIAGRLAAVAAEVGAHGVYLDQFGSQARRCFSDAHGHAPGAGVVPGEIGILREVRRALDRAGLRETMVYMEYNPVDVAAPYADAAFCYNIQFADGRASTAKLNLWRFVFPDVRLWDMVTWGVLPEPYSAEDFRLSLWHGNGAWLKGKSDTWFGEDLLAYLRDAHGLLKKHAAAFAGSAEPLVASPHEAVLVNRFRGGGETVHTLFNSSYRTVRFTFQGRRRTLGPRAVEVIAASLRP